MVKDVVKVTTEEKEIDFGKPILAVDGEPYTETDRKSGKEVPMTIGRVLGNLLYNFRPQPNPQRGVAAENFDAIKAGELGLRIYKGKKERLTIGELKFIQEIVDQVPFAITGIEFTIKKLLKESIGEDK